MLRTRTDFTTCEQGAEEPAHTNFEFRRFDFDAAHARHTSTTNKADYTALTKAGQFSIKLKSDGGNFRQWDQQFNNAVAAIGSTAVAILGGTKRI